MKRNRREYCLPVIGLAKCCPRYDESASLGICSHFLSLSGSKNWTGREHKDNRERRKASIETTWWWDDLENSDCSSINVMVARWALQKRPDFFFFTYCLKNICEISFLLASQNIIGIFFFPHAAPLIRSHFVKVSQNYLLLLKTGVQWGAESSRTLYLHNCYQKECLVGTIFFKF